MTTVLFCRKKYWLFGATILALILMCGSGHSDVADQGHGPKMVLKEQDFDFGKSSKEKSSLTLLKSSTRERIC